MTIPRVRSLYFRNFIFGVEDSLVSTVGLLSGIAVAGMSRETIFITGVVLILVEALSMAAGSFLSETSAEEYEHAGGSTNSSLFGGLIMFVSYFVAGFVPLLPYVVLPGLLSLPASIIFSLLALFLLGAVSGALSGVSVASRGLRMMLIGGVAIVAGAAAGILLTGAGMVAGI